MLLELGFQKSGPPVRAHFANGKTYLGQCFAADVQGRAADWHRRKHALLRRLAAAEERATRSVDSIKEG
jgi:hypothetical protein